MGKTVLLIYRKDLKLGAMGAMSPKARERNDKVCTEEAKLFMKQNKQNRLLKNMKNHSSAIYYDKARKQNETEI